jgi:hypothetical protein
MRGPKLRPRPRDRPAPNNRAEARDDLGRHHSTTPLAQQHGANDVALVMRVRDAIKSSALGYDASLVSIDEEVRTPGLLGETAEVGFSIDVGDRTIGIEISTPVEPCAPDTGTTAA